jgi:integrase
MSEHQRVKVRKKWMSDRGKWVLNWDDPGTMKRRFETIEADNEQTAEEIRGDMEYKLNHGLHQDGSQMSWEDFRALYEKENMPRFRPATRVNFTYAFDLFESICAPAKVTDISTRMLAAYAAELKKRKGRWRGTGMQVSSIRNYVHYIKIALDWAAKPQQGIIVQRPRLPDGLKVAKTSPRPVPVEWFEKLLAEAPDADYRLLLMFGWYAGMRLCEAYLIEWEETKSAPWVDMAEDKIRFPKGFSKSRRDDWVPLDPILKQAVQAHPHNQKRILTLRNLRNNEPLPPERWRTPSTYVLRMAWRAGLQKVSFHTLRKGFACRYASRGDVQPHVLQKLMRHARLSTTLEYYANFDDAVMGAVIGSNENGQEKGNKEGNKPAA